jgi:hypothetical protein
VGQNSSYSATFAHPVTAGDSIAAVFWWNYGIGWTISSVGDDKNDPFEQAFRLAIDENYSAWTYLSTNVSGGATTVTVQVSNANADQFAIAILEVKGATGVDQTNGPNSASCNGLSTLCSSLPVTTKHPNELILGFGVINVTGVVTPSSIMAGQGFTEQFASDFFAVETEPVTSVGSYQATLTVPSGSEYWGDVGIVTIY